MSSLLHAYKRNELEPETGLAFWFPSAYAADSTELELSESLLATWPGRCGA
ncbi:MAG: hypothetical protein H6669_06460 [Ardenticatenaceae bacterium]|nr:hypothetical protein [Ardenticatenaceae bacterium]